LPRLAFTNPDEKGMLCGEAEVEQSERGSYVDGRGESPACPNLHRKEPLMRSVRHLLTAAALLAAAACANADGITSPRSAAPPRLDSGGFIGSGAFEPPADSTSGIASGAAAGEVTAPTDGTQAGGGGERGGFIGSGA
jgi:hypothetical protein